MSTTIGTLHGFRVGQGLWFFVSFFILIYCFTTGPAVDQVFYDKERRDQANYNDEFAHG